MAKIVKSHPVAFKIKLENSQPHVNNTMTPALLRIVKHLDGPIELPKGNIKTDGINKKPEGYRSGSDWLIEENKTLRDMLKTKQKIIDMLEGDWGFLSR